MDGTRAVFSVVDGLTMVSPDAKHAFASAHDYLMPYSILRRTDVAEVVALATAPGPMTR